MRVGVPELLLDSQAALGESPAWDAEMQRLLWIDGSAGHVHIYDPNDATSRRIAVGQRVGCVVPHTAGSVLLTLRAAFAELTLAGEEVRVIAAPQGLEPRTRFNDGKCDPAGRFLAGTMDEAGQQPVGALYQLDHDGAVRQLRAGIQVSNGLAWSPDYRTLYYIDTPTRKVLAYDYDLASGQIANPRVVVRVAWPDGMTSDRQGRLWIALWSGGAVTVWDPTTGTLLERIPIPAGHVSSCTFGGPSLTDLYITTARQGLDAATLDAYPATGGLFRVRTNVEGMPSFRARLSLRGGHGSQQADPVRQPL